MHLTRKYPEPGASGHWIQVQHRKDAIEYAIVGIEEVCRRNTAAFEGDAVFAELEGLMKNWVVETLYQGAYLREYHLWEKDCKAYFATMRQRNGEKPRSDKLPKGVSGFPAFAASLAREFGVAIGQDVEGALEKMRVNVNVMKHEAGLTIDHFITIEEYTQGVTAINRFWETLMQAEKTVYA